MRYKITQEEYKKIGELMNSALNAPNKNESKRYIQELRTVGYGLAGAASNILSELCADVDNASGRVDDKARKESFCRTDFHKLNMFVEKGKNN